MYIVLLTYIKSVSNFFEEVVNKMNSSCAENDRHKQEIKSLRDKIRRLREDNMEKNEEIYQLQLRIVEINLVWSKRFVEQSPKCRCVIL